MPWKVEERGGGSLRRGGSTPGAARGLCGQPVSPETQWLQGQVQDQRGSSWEGARPTALDPPQNSTPRTSPSLGGTGTAPGPSHPPGQPH